MLYLYRAFSAEEPCDWWLFCGKKFATGRADVRALNESNLSSRFVKVNDATLILTLMMQFHHAVLVNAMKAKQSVDVAQCDALEHAVEHFSAMYTKHA